LIADSGIRKGATKQVKAYRLSFNSAENTIPKTEPLRGNGPKNGDQQTRKRNAEPLKEPVPKKDKPSLVLHELSDDWEPHEFGVNSESRKVVDGWPPGELAYQLEHFRAHHRKNGTKFKNWQDAWSTWVLNSRKFGAANGRSNTLAGNQSSDGLSSTTRAAIAVFGPDPGDENRVPQ
jgi:hypothetical protein